MAYKKMYDVVEGEDEKNKISFLHEITYIPPQIFDKVDASGFRPPHKQDFYEIIFFKGGSRDIKTADGINRFSAGDVFLIAPDKEHSGKLCKDLLDRYYIHIGKDIYEKYTFMQPLLNSVFSDKNAQNNKIRLSRKKTQQLWELLQRTDDILRFGSRISRQSEAFAYVLRIITLISEYSEHEEKQERKPELMLNILAYLENYYADIKSVSELCEKFYISKSTLWRLFKTWLNKSPQSVISDIKLEHAVQLMLDKKSVSEAASLCGFCDLSHFISSFKKKYSATPHKYISRILNGEGVAAPVKLPTSSVDNNTAGNR